MWLYMKIPLTTKADRSCWRKGLQEIMRVHLEAMEESKHEREAI